MRVIWGSQEACRTLGDFFREIPSRPKKGPKFLGREAKTVPYGLLMVCGQSTILLPELE